MKSDAVLKGERKGRREGGRECGKVGARREGRE